jgi:hypothetical protein
MSIQSEGVSCVLSACLHTQPISLLSMCAHVACAYARVLRNGTIQCIMPWIYALELKKLCMSIMQNWFDWLCN